ncbi:hypothetical protein RHMOL_Rhmol02G0119900 [Rhododendron molle]|uniref:Uncharacterized protein n=1 Tax=Rhododendron molle TaxID=49168 RepID=A0ACC0PQJ7_RHOML|nr:hypothetical protein RHMOL_Rhmol02G0119900 [Rhododendron molle]
MYYQQQQPPQAAVAAAQPQYSAAAAPQPGGTDFTIFVGDLAPDVTDQVLQQTFSPHYPSVKRAKIVTDMMTGRAKGCGFVRFGDGGEQLRAVHEMNGKYCSTRPMRIGPANKMNKGKSAIP